MATGPATPHDGTDSERIAALERQVEALRAQLDQAKGWAHTNAVDLSESQWAHEAAQRLASIVESSDDAIISKNLNGIVATWNKAAERLFGYTAAEMIGRHISVLIPADRQNEEPEIIERIRKGERVEHYETIRQRKDGSQFDISLTVSPVKNAAGIVVGASKIARDISQRRQSEATRLLLLNELNHRVKNTLANVQAIAQQTVKTAKDPADFAVRFSGRIQSLARVHSLLTDATWQGAELPDLVRDQLMRGAVDETRLAAWGPSVQLDPHKAVHMALMLHELGTNSVKYGALSAHNGQVTLTWSVKDGMLNLHWAERGGPPVKAPIARGFGTALIEQSASSSGGRAQMLIEADGVTWNISMALPPVEKSELAAELEKIAARPGDLAQRARATFAGVRFLVVEDEPMIAMDHVSRLEDAGAADVQSVGREKEALQAIEASAFDAALLDGNLHGQPVDKIAAALTRKGVPFVFVTGYGQAGLPTSFKNTPVLAKPFSDEQLMQELTKLLRKGGDVVWLKS